MKGVTEPVSEFVQLCGGVVAEGSVGARAQNGPPELGHARWLAGEGQVYATVERTPATVPEVALERVGGEPILACLPAGDDAMLNVKEIPATLGKSNGHGRDPANSAAGRHQCSHVLWIMRAK
jgi:hypothetical protein